MTTHVFGNNQVASFLSGIGIERTLIVAFVVSSVCNAVAGMLFLSCSGQVYLSLGEPYQMPAISTVPLQFRWSSHRICRRYALAV